MRRRKRCKHKDTQGVSKGAERATKQNKQHGAKGLILLMLSVDAFISPPKAAATDRQTDTQQAGTHCSGESTRQGALHPLCREKKAGNSSAPYAATHTPCVSRYSRVRGMSRTWR